MCGGLSSGTHLSIHVPLGRDAVHMLPRHAQLDARSPRTKPPSHTLRSTTSRLSRRTGSASVNNQSNSHFSTRYLSVRRLRRTLISRQQKVVARGWAHRLPSSNQDNCSPAMHERQNPQTKRPSRAVWSARVQPWRPRKRVQCCSPLTTRVSNRDATPSPWTHPRVPIHRATQKRAVLGFMSAPAAYASTDGRQAATTMQQGRHHATQCVSSTEEHSAGNRPILNPING